MELTLEPAVVELVRTLGLRPHPEGGYYREIWRAGLAVEPTDGRGRRAALTSIWFLLPAGAVSRWHRVRSDEVWYHAEGAPLELLQVPPDEWRLQRVRLGPRGAEQTPVHCVRANWWQAARSLGSCTLVSCTVGPGFEFADFELLSDRAELAPCAERCRRRPHLLERSNHLAAESRFHPLHLDSAIIDDDPDSRGSYLAGARGFGSGIGRV